MLAVYRNEQLRTFEKSLLKAGIFNALQLMENAGSIAFKTLLTHWPNAQRITVCCGKGNNGGDGLILARLARQHGLDVTVYLMLNSDEYEGQAKQALIAAQQAGVTIEQYAVTASLDADVIIDALLGSGLQGEVRFPYSEIIHTINQNPTPVLSIDVPSGLNADTGQILGCAIQADVTITFIGLKQGLLTACASACCGKVIYDPIGIPSEELANLQPSALQLTWNDIKPRLPRRSRAAHKGDYGHVLVVGGDYGMGGAVRMAAEAGMRVGAGLVSVATRPEHVSIVSGCRPEIMCYQIAHADDLLPLLSRASVIVIGPGLGKSDWAKSLLNSVLQQKIPKVVDADALNLLAEYPVQKDDWVLTPHPGEAARLLGTNSKAVQNDRFSAVQEIQQHFQGVAVLKGAGSIIQSATKLPTICAAGNPGMATAGMGDILSGIIGGLLAQHLSIEDAATVGVMIHALAADKAAEQGGERGLLATDLLGYLRELVNPS